MRKKVNKEDKMIKVGKWIAKHSQSASADTIIPVIGSNESQLRYLKLSAGFSGDSRRSGHHGG